MTISILMPALSPTMEEGTLSKWLVKVGDKIKPGDLIAEIETDKATMEVECIEEGFVSELLVKEGSEAVKINTPIARLSSEKSTNDQKENSTALDAKEDSKDKEDISTNVIHISKSHESKEINAGSNVGSIIKKPIISFRGIPRNAENDNFIFDLEDKIQETCRTFSLKNSKQEENLIEALRTNCRKTVKEKTGKRPYTNVNLVRI